MIVKVDKEENRALRWVLKASADKDRPALDGANVASEAIVASDGHRVHAAPLPAGLEPDQGTLHFGRVPASATELETEPVQFPFPDVATVVPRGEPRCRIAVDAKFLRQALEGCDGYTELHVRGKADPIEVFGEKDGGPRYALIMPMLTVKSRPRWHPFDQNERTEEDDDG